MNKSSLININIISKKIRWDIINQSYKKQSGHLGGCLSCVDIIFLIYKYFLKKEDTFVLSKGHCALALYSVLKNLKKISSNDLEKFLVEGSFYGEHPSPKLNNKLFSFSTGSLGHGLGFGSGIGYANKLGKKSNKIYILISDGELNCGTTWEAIMLAGKLKLDNVCAILDFNKLQATGKSEEILNLKSLESRFKSFGWNVIRGSGHKYNEMSKKFHKLINLKNKPQIYIADTIKGKGISFMEGDNNWHYRSPSKDDLNKIKKELDLI